MQAYCHTYHICDTANGGGGIYLSRNNRLRPAPRMPIGPMCNISRMRIHHYHRKQTTTSYINHFGYKWRCEKPTDILWDKIINIKIPSHD